MVLKILLLFVPVAIGLAWTHADPLWVFAVSAIAIIPLADQLAQSTEKVAGYLGSTIGSLLNASLGNAPEIIIGAFALKNGLPNVVKASITGSILMNLLIAPGLAMLIGGWRREKQTFNPTTTRTLAALMMLAAIGLLIPSAFGISTRAKEGELSLEIAIVLFVLYMLSLLFTLVTHKHLFSESEEEEHENEPGGLPKALGILAVVAVLLALVSEALTDALDPATEALGLSAVFAGVIVVGVLGNIAELFAAIRFAKADKMDLAMGSTLGAAAQVALVVAPVLLFLSYAFGNEMNLHFSTFEVVAITLAVFVVGNLTRDGESNWLEGVMLVAVYLMFGLGVYFLPESSEGSAEPAREVSVEKSGG
jgi:Ca2+:H+ antiporter